MYSEKCNESDKEYIIDKLVAYNLSKVKAEQQELFIDLSRKFVREGKIIAGIIAQMYCWNMVYVDTLWVDSESRGKGLGYRLLTELEDDAKKKGAKLIHLDTFDFQAKEFYEKCGYSVFGKLEDCSSSHCRFYMKKHLE